MSKSTIKKFILASQSPRRKAILSDLNFSFDCIPADIDEFSLDFKNLTPEEIAMKVSRSKADYVSQQFPDRIIVASDTIVVMERLILGKPDDIQEAKKMLKMLSGKTHEVISSISITVPSTGNQQPILSDIFCSTKVVFNPLTAKEINWYINTKDPFDKAGGYGIQGQCSLFIKEIVGDYYNVMGFPVCSFYQEIKRLKLKIHDLI